MISSYCQVLRLARHIDDQENEARACSNLAYLYTEAGYGWRAEILGCHALAIFNRLGYPHGQAHTHNHLGLLYTRLRQWELAQTHLTQACMIWQEMGDKHGVMWGELNLGVMYIDVGEYSMALRCLETALDVAKDVGELSNIGIIYNNMGTSYRLLDQLLEAKHYLWLAEPIFQRTNNSLWLAHVQTNLALVYTDQYQWAEANLCFQIALQLYRQIKHHYYEIETLLYLVKFELDQSHYTIANDYLSRAQLLLTPYLNNPSYSHLVPLFEQYCQELYGARA